MALLGKFSKFLTRFPIQTAEVWKFMNRHVPKAPKYEFSHKKLLRLGALLGPSCVSCLQLCGTFFRSVYVSIYGGSGPGPRLVHSEVHNPAGARRAHSVHYDQVQCRSFPLSISHTLSRLSCTDAPVWQCCFWSRNSHTFADRAVPAWPLFFMFDLCEVHLFLNVCDVSPK